MTNQAAILISKDKQKISIKLFTNIGSKQITYELFTRDFLSRTYFLKDKMYIQIDDTCVQSAASTLVSNQVADETLRYYREWGRTFVQGLSIFHWEGVIPVNR